MPHASSALKLETDASNNDDPRDRMVGEILDERYAIVEHLAGDTYRVFDMKTMAKTKLLLKPGGGYFVWEPDEPRKSAGTPPPIPPAAMVPKPPPIPPPPSARPTRPDSRFEAAWFARGELLELEDEDVEEISDYEAYQTLLERMALQM